MSERSCPKCKIPVVGHWHADKDCETLRDQAFRIAQLESADEQSEQMIEHLFGIQDSLMNEEHRQITYVFGGAELNDLYRALVFAARAAVMDAKAALEDRDLDAILNVENRLEKALAPFSHVRVEE